VALGMPITCDASSKDAWASRLNSIAFTVKAKRALIESSQQLALSHRGV
jgi:hypothetical protein